VLDSAVNGQRKRRGRSTPGGEAPPALATPERSDASRVQHRRAKAGGPFMRRIDESERPMPEIDLAKACFIIEKSREYLGEDAGVEADDSNPADDDEHIMLTDTAGRSIRRELIEFIKDLDEDEAAAVVALSWIGRGDFQPEEWKIAVAQAKERAEGPTWKYLLEMELLPDYLEDALSAFGRSCEGLGSADQG
jgi:hypothetical protein